MSLQVQFKPVSFPVTAVVINPTEDRRGNPLGFNIVVQGAKPNQQDIVGTVSLGEGREVAETRLSELRTLYLH